jgi:hypothetical protein
MRSFYTESATRHRATLTTGIHGGDRDWATTDRLTIENIRIQPMPESAVLAEPSDLTGAVSAWRLMGPYGIDLANTDRLEYTDPTGRTRWFEVIGEPLNYQSPTGSLAHSETTLRSLS